MPGNNDSPPDMNASRVCVVCPLTGDGIFFLLMLGPRVLLFLEVALICNHYLYVRRGVIYCVMVVSLEGPVIN